MNKRIRPHLKMSGTSYRVDETYIKVGQTCKYLGSREAKHLIGSAKLLKCNS